jgi:hypothetical protein
MTSLLSGPTLFCSTFTLHCSDDRAGMWQLIPCGVGGWAGPAAVEQTSVPPYKKQNKTKTKATMLMKVRKSRSVLIWAMLATLLHAQCIWLPWQWTHF